MTSKALLEFLASDTLSRLKVVKSGRHKAELVGYFGENAYSEYVELSDKVDLQHLAFGDRPNVVFIPGIMGSLLKSDTRGGIWWIDVRTRNFIDNLGLADDGKSDLHPEFQIVPVTGDPSYDPFLAALLAEPDLAHKIFAYDWRKSPDHSANDLFQLVTELYDGNGRKPVHIVAHSMGGLVARSTIKKHGPALWNMVGKIVFLGTPHYGAAAIAGYLKNHLWGFEMMALLGRYLSRNTLRSLWGVLSLLPAPIGVYPGTRAHESESWEGPYKHPCGNFNLYQSSEWKLELTADQSAQLQRILDATAAFHRDMYDCHQALDQNRRDQMMVIAGVGYQTLFRLQNRQGMFWEKMEKIVNRVQSDPHREGDGRVPLASAMLDHVPIRYVNGVHGDLPNIPAVYRDVFNCLKGEEMKLPDTMEEATSTEHLAIDEQVKEPNLSGANLTARHKDDAGLWQSTIQPERIEQLSVELEAERLPEFTRVRLL